MDVCESQNQELKFNINSFTELHMDSNIQILSHQDIHSFFPF